MAKKKAIKKTKTKPRPKKPTKAQKEVKRKQARKDTLNRQKKNLYSRIYKREDELSKLKRKRKGESKEDQEKRFERVDELSDQLLHLKSGVDKTRRQLGLKPRFSLTAKQQKKVIKQTDKRLKEQKDVEFGFQVHPKSPFPGWDIPPQIDEDLKHGAVQWYIIDGKKFPASDEVGIKMAGRILKKDGGSKKVFEVEYNFETKTARYSRLIA